MLIHRTQMTAPGRTAFATAVLTGLLMTGILTGCSATGTSAAATAPPRESGSVVESSAAFCSFLASVNAIAAKAHSQQQGLQSLETIIPRLGAQQATAPASVAADFRVVATAARQAAAHGTLSPLGTSSVAVAGTRLTAYCQARS
jgi:hypothetical protein